MPTKLRNMGVAYSANYNVRFKKAMLVDQSGAAIAVLLDPNDSGAGAGNGDLSDTTKIYIYKSTDRIDWTLVNTVSLSNTAFHSSSYDVVYSACIGPNDEIYLVYNSNSDAVKCIELDPSTYASVSAVTIENGLVGSIVNVDISASENGSLLVVAKYDNPDTGDRHGHYVFQRRTSDSTWSQLYKSTESTSANLRSSHNQTADVSVGWVPGGSGTVQQFVTTSSWLNESSDGGWSAYLKTANPTDAGVSTAVATLVDATDKYFNNSTSPGKRVRDLHVIGADVDEFAIAGQVMVSSTESYAVFGKWDNTGSPTLPLTNSGGHAFTFLGGTAFGSGVASEHFYYQNGNAYVKIGKVSDSAVNWGNVYTFDRGVVANPWFSCTASAYCPVGSYQDLKAHDILYARKNTDNRAWYVEALRDSREPAGFTPATGSTLTTSEPAVSADADIDRAYGQSRFKIVWQFAKDSGFTTSVKTFIQDDSKFAVVNGTNVSGTVVPFADILPQESALTQDTWYVRAAHIDEYGRQGTWTATQTFTVSHPPTASNLTPSGGNFYAYGLTTFNWNFSDAYVRDSQTAYQIVCTRVSDGATVFDTGKQTSSVKSGTGTISATYKGAQLQWQVRVWDLDDVAGPYSTPTSFYVTDPPSVAISSPTNGGTVSTGIMKSTFTVTVGDSRTIKNYRVYAMQGGFIARDTGWISLSSPLETGAEVIYDDSTYGPVYDNSTGYSLTVVVRDSAGLEGYDTVSFTTDWTPPASPAGLAVDTANYNVEGQGYVSVTWDDTAYDSDFAYYAVMRRDSEIDPGTLSVISTGEWKQVYSLSTTASSYEFKDYYAPSRKKVEYSVIQVVNRFGDLVFSEDNEVVAAYPVSEGYWLMEPLGNLEGSVIESIKLSQVTGDSYSDEYEEEEFTLAGRGRYVDRGDHLGVKGNLEAQLRGSGAASARIKRQLLMRLKDENKNLYLRTPFGDVYFVYVSNISVSRIAGVGLSEFVDIGVPYSQVAL